LVWLVGWSDHFCGGGGRRCPGAALFVLLSLIPPRPALERVCVSVCEREKEVFEACERDVYHGPILHDGPVETHSIFGTFFGVHLIAYLLLTEQVSRFFDAAFF
jgi:hypothetical protein